MKRELGPRIDALEMALNAMETARPETIAAVKNVLKTLTASSREAGLHEISSAAGLAGSASDASLKSRTVGFIQMLREQGRRQATATAILLIGTDAMVLPELETRFKAAGRDVIRAGSAK